MFFLGAWNTETQHEEQSYVNEYIHTLELGIQKLIFDIKHVIGSFSIIPDIDFQEVFVFAYQPFLVSYHASSFANVTLKQK